MNLQFIHRILFFYFVIIINLFSSEIVLKSSKQKYPVNSVEIFETSNHRIQAKDILLKNSADFKKTTDKLFDFSFSKSIFWLKFSVNNQTRKSEEFIIETPYFPALSVQIFIFSKEGVLEKKYLQNYIKHKNLNLILEIPKDSSKIIVLKCVPDGRLMKFPVNLWTKKGFAQKIIKEYSLLFLYFGIMLFLAINCIILGFLFKTKAYTAFGVYILTFILLFFYSMEIPRLFGVSTVTLRKATSFTFFLNLFSLLIFTQIYFEIKFKKLNLLFSFFEILGLFSMIIVLISKKFESMLSIYPVYPMIIFTVMSVILLTVLFHLNTKKKSSFYYVAAMSPYFIAFMVKIFELFKIIPVTFITEYSILIGGFTSVVLFYILIARSIKLLYKEKEDSQQSIIKLQKENNLFLEEQVNERTAELEDKNIQLEKQTKLMERKKETLHLLLLISSGIQRAKTIDNSTTSMLSEISDFFENSSFGIILNGERESIINSVYFYNTSDFEKNVLINTQDNILKKSNISGFQNDSFNILRYLYVLEDEVWSILPFFSSKGELLGKLLFKKKDFSEHHLEVITVFIDQMTVITENILLTTSLEKLANIDSLTGVYNRNFFDEHFNQCVELENSSKIHFSIISIDINGLKRVNDLYGHEEGDKLIVNAANILKNVTRESDILARIGGDEFIILCPSTNIGGAEILAERIRKLQDKTLLCFTSYDNENREKTCIHMSIGISSSSIVSTDNILKDADQKMYNDKKEYYKTYEKYRTHN